MMCQAFEDLAEKRVTSERIGGITIGIGMLMG